MDSFLAKEALGLIPFTFIALGALRSGSPWVTMLIATLIFWAAWTFAALFLTG